jgi:hypothetical protein
VCEITISTLSVLLTSLYFILKCIESMIDFIENFQNTGIKWSSLLQLFFHGSAKYGVQYACVLKKHLLQYIEGRAVFRNCYSFYAISFELVYKIACLCNKVLIKMFIYLLLVNCVII